jgi:hypothetical protein
VKNTFQKGYTIRIEKDGALTFRTPSGRAIGWALGNWLRDWIAGYCSKGAKVDLSRFLAVKDRQAQYMIHREIRNSGEFETTEQVLKPDFIQLSLLPTAMFLH